MGKYILLLLFLPIVFSCNSEKKKPVYSDLVETEKLDYAVGGEEIVVPFRNENGVKYVKVSVNGIGLEMIFDTGCSGALISVAEANYLYNKGKLTQDDILGSSQSKIADGSVVENTVVNLKEVVINDQISCPNVKATVSNSIDAPLLLGNEILDRVATITIDNENENLIFKLK